MVRHALWIVKLASCRLGIRASTVSAIKLRASSRRARTDGVVNFQIAKHAKNCRQYLTRTSINSALSMPETTKCNSFSKNSLNLFFKDLRASMYEWWQANRNERIHFTLCLQSTRSLWMVKKAKKSQIC